jgi:hypothetical protein
MNLILNGIEAMSAVKERVRDLVIRTQRSDGDQVRVGVQDSGVGTDLLNAERIFDAFHSTKPAGMRSPLKLSAVRSCTRCGPALYWTGKDARKATKLACEEALSSGIRALRCPVFNLRSEDRLSADYADHADSTSYVQRET